MTASTPAVNAPKIMAGPQLCPGMQFVNKATFLDTKLYNTIQGVAPNAVNATNNANNTEISERPNTEPKTAIPTATDIAEPNININIGTCTPTILVVPLQFHGCNIVLSRKFPPAFP